MITVQGKEELKAKIFLAHLSLFLYCMFFIQKRFQADIHKVLMTTVALENIH